MILVLLYQHTLVYSLARITIETNFNSPLVIPVFLLEVSHTGSFLKIVHELLFFFPLVAYVISSVQFSHSVVFNSLLPHEPQHTWPPCSSPTPRVYPNPCSSSWLCHPTISSFVVPFSSCPQSFPASGSFQMSQLCASGGQSIGVSASTSVLPMITRTDRP